MMNRRTFIKGTAVVALAPFLSSVPEFRKDVVYEIEEDFIRAVSFLPGNAPSGEVITSIDLSNSSVDMFFPAGSSSFGYSMYGQSTLIVETVERIDAHTRTVRTYDISHRLNEVGSTFRHVSDIVPMLDMDSMTSWSTEYDMLP